MAFKDLNPLTTTDTGAPSSCQLKVAALGSSPPTSPVYHLLSVPAAPRLLESSLFTFLRLRDSEEGRS
jgi:hypothetical protein